MAIRGRDQQALDQCFSEYGAQYGGSREDYFALLYLRDKFKCEAEEVAHQVAFGKNDLGIDAYFVDRAARNLYLYQFKWSEDHNLFKAPLERLAKEGMARVFSPTPPGAPSNAFLRYLRADLREHKALIDRIYIRFVFKGAVEAADNSVGLGERLENLESKKYLVDNYFGDRQVDLIVEFMADRPGAEREPARETYTIPFAGRFSIQTVDGTKTMHLGLIALMDLYCMYRNLGHKFIDRNIRAGLAPEHLPNRRIREALGEIVLEQTDSPEIFAFNHNGVTLSAAQVDFADGQATIHVPRLLNGAQTLVSLDKFLEDKQAELLDAAHSQALNAIRVLAKIVVCEDRNFVTQVTICNNQQNPVEAWNLRANDRIQCDLQDKFREEVGIYYARQENAFDNLSDVEKQELGIQAPRELRLKPLAQTFLAVQGEIGRMSALSEVFENQRYYHDTFRESYLRGDARKMVLAYKVGLMLDGPIQQLTERAPGRMPAAIGRARNLVWALMIQALFNSRDLTGLLARFGGSLSREADLNEYLKKSAAENILPILREVLADTGYNNRIGEGKYSFLLSKEPYKRCMEVAHEKYGWVKKTW